jgi:hypothetical protein
MLEERSSAPVGCPHRLPAETLAKVERLRRTRMTGPAIARELGLARSTVGAVLRRLGRGRLKALDPRLPAIRYERAAPGELIHIDTKKLGKIDGVGHRITGDRRGQKKASAGIWSMSASTMPPASPTPRSCPTRRRRAPARSSPGRWPSWPPTASASSG